MALVSRSAMMLSLVIIQSVIAGVWGNIICPLPFSTLADPQNCKGYVQCVFSNPVNMPCPNGLAYSSAARTCVYERNSDCGNAVRRPIPVLLTYPTDAKPQNKPTVEIKTTTEAQTRTKTTEVATTTTQKPTIQSTTERPKPVILSRSIEDECLRNPRAKFPHPTECAQYYDCSVIYKTIPKYYEQFLMECPYAQLFNDRTLRCDSHSNVKCGRRREAKEPCDYIQNLCQTANCRPCSSRFPSCGNKPDGVNAWGQREWTPYFVRCQQERLMDQGLCEYSKGYPTLFSPESKSCVSIFSVPKKFGGYQPDCSRKRNGFYPDENGKCNVYFQCKDNEFRDTFECPSGRVFDADSSLCKFPTRVRGKCGTFRG